MTVRVTFELSADLDVDSEAAERSQARSHQPGDGQAGTVQRRTRNRENSAENNPKWTQTDAFVGCAFANSD